MEFWNTIVHTALLGTDKKPLKKEDFRDDLAEVLEVMDREEEDKESRFLNMASIVLNYKKCGFLPLHKAIDFSKAEREEKAYCSPLAQQLLSDVILAESFPLLQLWLNLCEKKAQLITPEWVPVLLDYGNKYKRLQPQLLAVTGNRGAWLQQWNNSWKWESQMADEESWQRGTLDQRKEYLTALRNSDPGVARAMLQEAWGGEAANTKAELLKILTVNISNEDVAWLEPLMNEKSVKVKEEVLRLLKLCPASSVVQKYWEIIKESISIKKERGLLGFGSKTVVEIALSAAIDEKVFASGIEKMGSHKEVSDEDFILYQLIAAVPPSFFEGHCNLDKKEIIDLFLKEKRGKRFISAFGLAACIFKEKDWLQSIIAVTPHEFYPNALEVLPKEERDTYALPFLQRSEAHQVLDYYTQKYEGEWTLVITRAVFKYTVKNLYTYNRSFYQQHILSIPATIIPELETFAPAEAYLKNTWAKTSEYLSQQLTLKTKITQVFQL